MIDSSFNFLLQYIRSHPGQHLLLADENLRDAPLQSLPADSVCLLTNRFDLYHQAKSCGLTVQFSDFDFSAFSPGSFSSVLYRVSKEKPVVNHIINRSLEVLAAKGSLVLIGAKNEGIKTYSSKAAKYFNQPGNISKNGSLYSSIIEKPADTTAAEPLDDKDYCQLRQIGSLNSAAIISKPGVFGWNKIDQGSAFLVEYLPDFLASFKHQPDAILDLGCGYGYLSIAASQVSAARIVATDNNAAALVAAEKNFQELAINGEVFADDCAQNISERFKAVICNPPFHQGFATDNRLTERFIKNCYSRLRRSGKALFVVNGFVPLESLAGEVFPSVTRVAENRSFKLIVLAKD